MASGKGTGKRNLIVDLNMLDELFVADRKLELVREVAQRLRKIALYLKYLAHVLDEDGNNGTDNVGRIPGSPKRRGVRQSREPAAPG